MNGTRAIWMPPGPFHQSQGTNYQLGFGELSPEDFIARIDQKKIDAKAEADRKAAEAKAAADKQAADALTQANHEKGKALYQKGRSRTG